MSEQLEIVIVGGGTAGWMCAAALANVVKENVCRLRLIESDAIGGVGVGEATLPQMKEFNDRIGINEADMMQKTNATFKLGIEFVNWGKMGASYIHPFGTFGEKIGGIDFHDQWNRLRQSETVEPIETFSYAIEACRQNRFEFPVEDHSEINSTYSYAYHFDATLYAQYLRKVAEAQGLQRTEGKIVSVNQHPDTGAISSVTMESGEIIAGDYFIDCSGFRSLLTGQALQTSFEDWSSWLICDRAWAVPCERKGMLTPYTRSTGKSAGWQWRIPLQHRTGNGYVYSSQFISDDEAAHSLLSDLDGPALADPLMVKFKAGRYKNTWQKNCIAIGLSSGFLEPLESTSIYLIQVAIVIFLKLFPNKTPDQALIDEYNRLIDMEYDKVKDFLILHYKLNSRDDSEFWRHCREMDVPNSLLNKIAMFKHRGHIESYRYGLFAQPSWVAVFMGQGLLPDGSDPYAQNVPLDDVKRKLSELSASIKHRVQMMPTHEEFIADYCPSKL
jgi:tryptophan halogenase